MFCRASVGRAGDSGRSPCRDIAAGVEDRSVLLNLRFPSFHGADRQAVCQSEPSIPAGSQNEDESHDEDKPPSTPAGIVRFAFDSELVETFFVQGHSRETRMAHPPAKSSRLPVPSQGSGASLIRREGP